MINTLISALQQLIAFSLIPFLVYLIRYKTIRGFGKYIGLKKSTRKANGLAILIMLLLASPLIFFASVDTSFMKIFQDPNTVSGKIKAMGFGLDAVVTILIMAVIKTSLAEEIFFRGFLAKRLIALTNYRLGNWIQAIVFGAVHVLIFLIITDNIAFLITMFVVPTIGAYLKTHLNEKLANGSIIPGWITHASANALTYFTLAFVL